MTHPRFVSLSTTFWPTRKIAQHQASQLFDLVSGFVYSQILFAVVKLKLLDTLRKQPQTLQDIASSIGRDEATTLRLLKAANALKLTTELPGKRYGLGDMGAALIANPGLKDMVLHHHMFYNDMADPLALLDNSSTTQLGNYWTYAKPDNPNALATANDDVRPYSELMAASQPMVSEQVFRSYDFNQHQHVMDLGGGTGKFLINLRQRYSNLALTLFDLPAVAQIATANDVATHNINQVAGDFFKDELPIGADLITLVRILHDHNDDAVTLLLQNIYEALPRNGRLLIAEPLADTPGAKRIGDAYFNFYFLAMGKGEARSVAKLTDMLTQTGFNKVTQLKTAIPLVCSVITADK